MAAINPLGVSKDEAAQRNEEVEQILSQRGIGDAVSSAGQPQAPMTPPRVKGGKINTTLVKCGAPRLGRLADREVSIA